MKYYIEGKYKNGDSYFESTDDLLEIARIITEIDRMWHDLESTEAEPHEIINPYTLEIGIDNELTFTNNEIKIIYSVMDEYKEKHKLDSFMPDSFWTAYDKIEDERFKGGKVP